MRFHVLGIGSVGTLVAHHLRLAQPTADICLVVRNAAKFTKPKLREGSEGQTPLELKVAQNGGDTRTSTGYELDVSSPGKADNLARALLEDNGPEAAANIGAPIDSLIVTTKTHATARAISGLQDRIRPTSVITLLQNGMGVYDELCAKFWPEPTTRPQFILGTTTHGVTPSDTPGSVMHMSRPGQGEIKLGVVTDPRGEIDFEQWLWGRSVGGLPALTPPASPSLPLPPPPDASVATLHGTLAALLSMSPLSPRLLPMPHLYHELLVKLAVNSAINPLTAVLGGGYLMNGSLHRSGPGHRLVQQTCKETSAVLTAYLHNMSPGGQAPPDTVRLFAPASLVAKVHEVIAATRDNISSMAGDVKSGRPTEIDYINGFLVSLGNRLGVPTPTNRMLVQMVKFKAEVGGLNSRLYPQVQASVKRGEESALELRRLSLEERKVMIEERAMMLREDRMQEAKRARRELKRQVRRNRIVAQKMAEAAAAGGESNGEGSAGVSTGSTESMDKSSSDESSESSTK